MLPAKMNSIIEVCGVEIKQDAEGRFCLNDLYRASGGENKHRPSLWLANKQTIDLVTEIAGAVIPAPEQFQPLSVVNGGDHQGTYVCKELVYAYAMWISPKFHLQVIRAYDAMVTVQQIPSHSEALRAWADQLEENEKLETRNKILYIENRVKEDKLEKQKPKVEFYDTVAGLDTTYDMKTAAKMFGLGQNALFEILRKKKVLMGHVDKKDAYKYNKHPNHNSPYQSYVELGYFEVKMSRVVTTLNQVFPKTVVTGKGMQWLLKKLREWGEINVNQEVEWREAS